ncbi:Polyketide biosynthesis cytochrome P450 PksS [Streptomyces sp. enrichment culture]
MVHMQGVIVGPVTSGTVVDPRSVVSLVSRLRATQGQDNPYPIYAKFREMGDVVPTPWGAQFLTTYEICDTVLRDKRWKALDGEWRARQGDQKRWSAPASRELGEALQGINPPHHTRQRRALGNLFDRHTVGRLYAPLGGIVDELLDGLAERMRDGEADFAELVSERLPVAAIGEWLGIPRADHELLVSLTHGQAYAQELLPSASQLAIANTATLGLREYFTGLIRDRRATMGDDVLSRWIRVWDELEPDRDQADETLYYLAMFIVIAALETTSTVLSSMIWTLDQHPDQLSLLRRNPDEVPAAVEEALRYDPPVHVTTRAAGEDMDLAGVSVARDQLIHIVIASANHDPARNDNPDTFDLRRKGGHLTHLSFGGGIHYCIGAGLARLEATLLLERVIKRFPTLRVSAPPEWEPRVAFRRVRALYVVDG